MSLLDRMDGKRAREAGEIPVLPPAVVAATTPTVQPVCQHCAQPITLKGIEWVHTQTGTGPCSAVSMTLPGGAPNWDFRFK